MDLSSYPELAEGLPILVTVLVISAVLVGIVMLIIRVLRVRRP